MTTARRLRSASAASSRTARSPPSPASNVSSPSSRRPNVSSIVNSTDVMRTVVGEINRRNRRKNTAAAYDPKSAEFEEYCDYAYSELHPSIRYTVDAEKLFKFLFYHAMRDKYKVGGRRRGRHGFDGSDYDRVWQSYSSSVVRLRQYGGEPPDDVMNELFKDPPKPLGYDQLNTYKSMVRGIWETQIQQNANTLSWDRVFTYESKSLLEMVKTRRGRIRRATYQEKLEGDFTPFTSLGQVAKIETQFWNNGKKSSRAALPTLRNRMTFLNCYNGVLRHETLFNGELSDMVGLQHLREKDAHEIFVMVMQMSTGKCVKKCVRFELQLVCQF